MLRKYSKRIPIRLIRNPRIFYHEKEQFAYGHREILLQYLELPRNVIFSARLHHANVLPYYIDPISPMTDEKGRSVVQIYWRSDVIETSKTLDIKDIHAIGSPFLYMLVNSGFKINEIERNIEVLSKNNNFDRNLNSILSGENDKKILFLPAHSWEGEVLSTLSSQISYLKLLQPALTTVCLGFLDFCDPRIRNSYEERGFKTVCAGIRGSIIDDSPAGGRIDFLQNLRKLIESHELVLANYFTTGLLYANALGKEAVVIPDKKIEIIYSSYIKPGYEFNEYNQELGLYFSWFYNNKAGPDEIYKKIHDSLGLENFKTRSELLRILPYREF